MSFCKNTKKQKKKKKKQKNKQQQKNNKKKKQKTKKHKKKHIIYRVITYISLDIGTSARASTNLISFRYSSEEGLGP